MKKYLALLFLFLALKYCKAQTNYRIDVAKLIQITQSSDYFAFVRLSKTLPFIVLDSSKDKSGAIFYITKEFKYHGNTLACGTDSKLKIKQLSFLTYEQDTYSYIKKQLKASGLKSAGTGKGGFPEILEAEDFEGKGIYVGSSAKKTEDDTTQYEFIFFKW